MSLLDYLWFPSRDQFVEHGSADNAQVQLQHDTGASDKDSYLTTVFAGYDASATGTLTIAFAGGTNFVIPLHDDLVWTPPRDFCGEHNRVTATLTASGTGGTLGYLTLIGYEAPSTVFSRLFD